MAGVEQYGRRHSLLPRDVVLEDNNAYQAFDSLLNKAVGETIYMDWFFFKTIIKTHSAGDAKNAIAGLFSRGVRNAGYGDLLSMACYEDHRMVVCEPLYIISAADVYQLGKEIDALNKDGGGLSYSDVASIVFSSEYSVGHR